MNSRSSPLQEIRAHIGRGDLVAAERACRRVLAADPDAVVAGFYLAFVLWRQGQAQTALERCRRTLSLRPADAGLLSDLGNLFRELGAETEALEALDASLQIRPGHPGALYNRALALDALGRDREALALLDAFRAGDALYPKARYLRGTIRQDLGDTRGAESDFRDCIGAEPGHAGAWHALVATRRFTPQDNLVPRLEEQIARAGADPAARRRLLFSLAKLHDDVGEYKSATDRLLQANRLVDARYDARGIEDRLGLLRENFRSPPPNPGGPATRPNPVFIVGLPRSGTTLVETMLERHPDVTALGELDVLPRLVADFGRPPDAAELRALGVQYLESLPPGAENSTLVLDKMPENAWRAGYIAWMFPHTRIVYCRRDERDVAISNFFNLYASGNNFAYSMEDLAHYSACHRAVMRHWASLLPERIFQVDYDRLVSRPRECMAALAEFLSLEWDETSRDSSSQPTRRIRTASNWQVRQDIYTTSVGRWKNYPRLAEEFSAHFRAAIERIGRLP